MLRKNIIITLIVILGCGISGFSKSCVFFFLLCLCDFDGERKRSGEYLDLCFSFLRFLLALYVAISDDKFANVLSIELSMALLSLSLPSTRRDENDKFWGTKLFSCLLEATLVEAFEFSLWESFGLSATMGVIDIKGVFVKVGDVKLRLCIFLHGESPSPADTDACSLCLDFFIFFSFLSLSSEPSFSLLNSNGLMVTLIGDILSGVVNLDDFSIL